MERFFVVPMRDGESCLAVKAKACNSREVTSPEQGGASPQIVRNGEVVHQGSGRLYRLLASWMLILVLEFPPSVLFAALVSVRAFHLVYDNYLLPQIHLMTFQDDGRDHFEGGYYHRYCTGEEVSATSISQLIIPNNFTGEESAKHQMIHGASVYRDLLTLETASQLRELIVEGNSKEQGFFVLENEFRYSWGIDINRHPAFKQFWKELASNQILVDALQEIVGPDPAVIEFTAITSSYGAKAQDDHQDVLPDTSAAKFPHTFVPSYSLFIPLQDTSYDMGATQVCPGTHICGDGAEHNCLRHNLAMSGDDDIWPTGWGALVNQQTTHKGMGHTKQGGLDRVVIIATFAPRPQTFRQLETRMIAQGGSYSMAWSQWGHTFSDFVHADQRMWEPLKTMRSLGLWKAKGWNWVSITSMRIANNDNGYKEYDWLDFEDMGGLPFLPSSWQGRTKDDDGDENVWCSYVSGTVERTEKGLRALYTAALLLCLIIYIVTDFIRGLRTHRQLGHLYLARGLVRLLIAHGFVILIAYWGLKTIDESNWAKDIVGGKAYRLPKLALLANDTSSHNTHAVFPTDTDVLIVPHYSSDHLAAYGRVIDWAHPGNVRWNDLIGKNAQGYKILTSQLQEHFCQSLLAFVHQDARFLRQGNRREWLPITDSDELLDVCHQDLMSASDRRVAAMVREVRSLKTATNQSRFWDTVLHKDIIPRYLRQWESLLVPQRSESPRRSVSFNSMTITKRKLDRLSSRARRRREKGRYTIPKVREPLEPFPLAWIREGDAVEAMIDCEPPCKCRTQRTDYCYQQFMVHAKTHGVVVYYHGKVRAIDAHFGLFDIEYVDGTEQIGVQQQCLRRFVPFQVGERVHARTYYSGIGTVWFHGVIVAIRSDSAKSSLLDVSVNGVLMSNIKLQDIRRFDSAPRKPGDWVAVMDAKGGCKGKILQTNPDGTFRVKCRDGTVKPRIPSNKILKHKASM